MKYINGGSDFNDLGKSSLTLSIMQKFWVTYISLYLDGKSDLKKKTCENIYVNTVSCIVL